MTDDWQDAPEWLNSLIAGRPQATEVLRLWETVWKPELAKRGISPDMLGYVGDPAKPRAIDVSPPGVRRLVQNLDR
jgi:hypothetical protein